MQEWPVIMQIWHEGQKCRRIGVLLFDQFSNHCLANAIEPLRAANTLSRRNLYSWQFLGIEGRTLRASSGLPVTPDAALSQAEGGDYLFVMPSYGFRDHAGPQVLRSLRAAARRWRVLVGLDTGSWLLAAAGLLDGRRATIHWDERDALAETFPDVTVLPSRFVIDGDRISCGGVSTAFDLLLDLITRHHGPMLALEVAALFMHATPAPMRGLRPSADATIHAAVALMRQNLETPLTIVELAAALGLTRKALARLFHDQLGAGPAVVARAIRLREARRLVEHSGYGIAEIATRCGYQDAAAMTRAYRAEFSQTPSQSRRRRG